MKFPKLKNPAILAAMAGICDGKFCKIFEDFLGMVTLGGISVDERSMLASEKIVERGRKEFLENFEDFMEENFILNCKTAVNIRSSTLEGYVEAGKIVSDYGGILEINAHCRQQEIIEVKAGEYLLHDLRLLEEILKEVRDEVSCPVILKFRGNVVSEKRVYEVSKCYVDALHVDAMSQKCYPDIECFKRIPKDIFLIGNNSIKTPEVAREVLKYCDAFSFARIAFDLKMVKNIVENL